MFPHRARCRAGRAGGGERLQALAAFIDSEQTAGRPIPEHVEELYDRWVEAHPAQELPLDLFDGQVFGYVRDGESYVLWSSGPDQEPDMADDLEFTP